LIRAKIGCDIGGKGLIIKLTIIGNGDIGSCVYAVAIEGVVGVAGDGACYGCGKGDIRQWG
jgi:hypothetical protein